MTDVPNDVYVTTAVAKRELPGSSDDDFSDRRLWQLIVEYDGKHEAGHKRLRDDHRELESRIEVHYRYFNDKVTILQNELTQLRAKQDSPVDATRLMLSTKPIVTLLVGITMLVGVLWTLRLDVVALGTRLEESQKQENLRMDNLRQGLESTQKDAQDAKRSYELLRYEVQGLKEQLAKKLR
jgi:hypothetical protein